MMVMIKKKTTMTMTSTVRAFIGYILCTRLFTSRVPRAIRPVLINGDSEVKILAKIMQLVSDGAWTLIQSIHSSPTCQGLKTSVHC